MWYQSVTDDFGIVVVLLQFLEVGIGEFFLHAKLLCLLLERFEVHHILPLTFAHPLVFEDHNSAGHLGAN